MEAVLPENDFLSGYRKGTTTEIPYFAHLRMEGERFDYVTIEYRDNEIEKRLEGELVYHEPNEFLVLVLDKSRGDILQCIDSSCMDAEKVAFMGWIMFSARIFYLWRIGILMERKISIAIRAHLARGQHPILPYLLMSRTADCTKTCRNLWGSIRHP